MERKKNTRAAHRLGSRSILCLEPLEIRNLLSFGAASNYVVGNSPFSISAADLNGDERLDLAVGLFNINTGKIAVLMGSDDGSFQKTAEYVAGVQPTSIRTADFDNDGTMDLAVGNSGGVSVLLGNGNGTFQSAIFTIVGNVDIRSIAIGNFDDDSRVDVLAIRGSNPVGFAYVLNGNGDGTFTTGASYSVGAGSAETCIADFNSDGRADAAIAYNGTSPDYAGGVAILLGKGDGTFSDAGLFPAGEYAFAVQTADLDGDGNLDLATTNVYSDSVSVLHGNGDGSFQPQISIPIGETPNRLAIGDVDSDGRPDLAVTLGSANQVAILRGNRVGSFAPAQVYPVGLNPGAVVAEDFNLDNRVDLVVANGWSYNLTVLLNANKGRFPKPRTYETGEFTESPVSGDFDGDGFEDVAAVNRNDDTVVVLRSTGRGFRGPIAYGVQNGPRGLVAGDFNRDSNLDLIVSHPNAKLISLLFGIGNGMFEPPTSVSVPIWPGSLTICDCNLDGSLDVALTSTDSFGNGTVEVLLGNGDGTFLPLQAVASVYYPGNIRSSDFSGDGAPDLVFYNTNSSNDKVTVILGNGDGTFGPAKDSTIDHGILSGLAVSDFNGDGRVDLAVGSWFYDSIRVALGNGDGTFQSISYLDVGQDPVSVTAKDFNGDGFVDIATANSGSLDATLLLGNGDGTFRTATHYAVGFELNGITAGDFNGDMRPDLALTTGGESPSYAGKLVALYNTSGTHPSPSLWRDFLPASGSETAKPVSRGDLPFPTSQMEHNARHESWGRNRPEQARQLKRFAGTRNAVITFNEQVQNYNDTLSPALTFPEVE